MGAFTIITGNLGKNPELRYFDGKDGEPASRAMCGFSVRQTHDRKNKETEKYEDVGGFWVDVRVWGRDAEQAAKVLKKGYPVKVQGVLYMDTWEDAEGATRQTLRLDADRDGVTLMTYNLEGVTLRPSTKPPADSQPAAGDSSQEASAPVDQ